MKKLAYLLILIPFLSTSCSKDPYAGFIMSSSRADVGKTIYFTNQSADVNSVDWDFGDGYYSKNFNTSHEYSAPGIYTITLTAFGKNGKKDMASSTIRINDFAELEIEVVEYYDDFIVPDASVRLYPTIKDWENQTNMVVEGFTGDNGRVTFTGLLAGRRYYVDVWGDDHDNLQLAEEDAGFIETQVLKEGFNSFIAYVDYYEPEKKSAALRKGHRSVGTKNAEEGKTLRVRSEKMMRK